MFWLGGFFTLEVTTSTADALCPPLDEARAAIQSRVGDVRGEYHVAFSLVRSDAGGKVLDLVVQNKNVEVLHRQLPLDESGCRDAAQAIALVLERYFDAVETPELEPVPVPAHRASDRAVAARKPETTDTEWRADLSLLYDRNFGFAPRFGVQLFPAGLRLSPRTHLGFGFEASPFATKLHETVREQSIDARTVELAVSFPLELRAGPWSAALAPSAALWLQRAEGASLPDEHPGYRAIASGGAHGTVQWAWSAPWRLSLGAAAGLLAKGATTRFVLQTREDGRVPVLAPEPWFGQVWLGVARAF
jgi:hypothetical protein